MLLQLIFVNRLTYRDDKQLSFVGSLYEEEEEKYTAVYIRVELLWHKSNFCAIVHHLVIRSAVNRLAVIILFTSFHFQTVLTSEESKLNGKLKKNLSDVDRSSNSDDNTDSSPWHSFQNKSDGITKD